ncbi:MAG: hypothetical protein WCC87_19575 [Candidatus Korobacteraceae bacterium]
MKNRTKAWDLAYQDLEQALQQTHEWLSSRNYSGYEPYDLLNSPYLSAGIFRRPPLSFALLQFGKRVAGLRLRQLLRIPPSKNPKALALVLSALCDLTRTGEDYWQEADDLKSMLWRLRSPRESEFCWGYDWDYMSLRGTNLPAFSPNSIASYFCGEALLDMAQVFGDREAAEMGESVGRFMVTRLNRSVDTPEQLCFSYTPSDRTVIYNSSALAGAYLARLASLKPNAGYRSLARRAMNYVRSQQLANGGWYYGALRKQHWIDGFHTSYVLCALDEYRRYTGDRSFDEGIRRGHAYYNATFFVSDGAPKYFHNQLYPVDIHSCSQAILHHCTFADQDPAALSKALATFRWTQQNMVSENGAYYFQRHRTWVNRAEYTRWGQAWMFRALARLRLTLRGDKTQVSALLSRAGGI